MRIDILTIFPEYLAPLELSLVGRAVADGLIDLQVADLRHWASDRHRTVDDAPYGGGPGMVMRPDVWGTALDDVLAAHASPAAPLEHGLDDDVARSVLVIPTPSGQRLTQSMVAEFAQLDRIVVACGRYEGIDARVAQHYRSRLPVFEVSLADVVFAGGEVVALALVEAVARLLPGVLGNESSAVDDSFAPDRDPEAGALEAPVFTRPPQWRGLEVPEVLRSGDHGAIRAWRAAQSRARTAEVRPDLVVDE